MVNSNASNPAGITDIYLMPARYRDENDRLAWLKQTVEEGTGFLASQTSATEFGKGRALIAGANAPIRGGTLSKVTANLTKRIIRDVSATLSNIRPIWGYSTDNRAYDGIAELLNKLLMSWFLSNFADRALKGWIQYALVMGSGWIAPTWESRHWNRGYGDIELDVYSPEDVIPTQLPADGNYQRAYAMTLRKEVPINLARAMFPTKAMEIIPDRTSPKGFGRFTGKVMSFLSPVLNRFGVQNRTKRPISAFPTVDVYQTFIVDLSINEGPDAVVMGEPGTSWSYIVPVLGSQIPNGKDSAGNIITRTATTEDCMFYPFRRLITWTNSGILRDGPSPWWHGLFPGVKLSLDSWPWEFLGMSTSRDISSLDEANNNLRRAMTDSANARLRPALMFDDRSQSQSTLDSFDTRVPGNAIAVDFTANERPIRPVLEAGYYDAPSWIPEFIANNEGLMKYLAGASDVDAIAKARQIPASDSIEKILEMAGPMVTDMTREMEYSLMMLAVMLKAMFFQWYSSPRRMQRLGIDGITLEDGDLFDPKTLTPSHMPGEPQDYPSAFTNVQRARRVMESIFFKITPNSLHQVTQLTRKLIYIQLQKSGVPIDPWTIAEVFDIPNFGKPPVGANTVYEKWVAFEKMKGELSTSIQLKSQEMMSAFMLKQQMMMSAMGAAMPAPGGEPPPGGEGGPEGGEGGASGSSLPQKSYSPALGHNPPGRPAEFNGAPRIESKDGGTRSTITSSK